VVFIIRSITITSKFCKELFVLDLSSSL